VAGPDRARQDGTKARGRPAPQRVGDDAVRRRRPGVEGSPREQALALGSRIGNQRMASLLPALLGADSPGPDAPVAVGPVDHALEAEADRAAAAVARGGPAGEGSSHAPGATPAVQRAARPSGRAAIGPDGGPLPADVSRGVAADGAGARLPTGVLEPMEAAFGTSFADVRLHAGHGAGAMADRLGAHAFTHGADVYAGPGTDLVGPAGRELLAHELAHVVQQRHGRVAPMVQAKLKGVRSVVIARGGDASTKAKFFRSSYTTLLGDLKKYEDLETKVLGRGGPMRPKDRTALGKALDAIVADCDQWLAGAKEDASKIDFKTLNKDRALNHLPRLDGTCAPEDLDRQHVVLMVRARAKSEAWELDRPGWFADAPLSDDTLLGKGKGAGPGSGVPGSKDDVVGGALNRLDWVEHDQGPGQPAHAGFFIQDRGHAKQSDAGAGTGISSDNPQQGARSVAMFRLALVLNSSHMAEIRFATHESATDAKGKPLAQPEQKMGVVSALAKGKTGEATSVARTDAERAEMRQAGVAGPDTVSLEDPYLQQSLNIIQVIDYIARQVDRHWHNYYIETEGQGKVTGVKGIDLDQAFGARVRGVDLKDDKTRELAPAGKFVGMPDLIDLGFAKTILGTDAAVVRAALQGLLSDAEVDGAIERFVFVQDRIREMQASDVKRKKLVAQWDASTAAAQRDKGDGAPTTSYAAELEASRWSELEVPIRRKFQAIGIRLNGLHPRISTDLLDKALASIGVAVAGHTIRPDQAALVGDAVDAAFASSDWHVSEIMFELDRDLLTAALDQLGGEARVNQLDKAKAQHQQQAGPTVPFADEVELQTGEAARKAIIKRREDFEADAKALANQAITDAVARYQAQAQQLQVQAQALRPPRPGQPPVVQARPLAVAVPRIQHRPRQRYLVAPKGMAVADKRNAIVDGDDPQ
jgi:hypothetical protein